MEERLRKLKVIDDVEITLPMMKSDFINKLKNSTEEGSTSSFFPLFEAFSGGDKLFKGSINGDNFKVRKHIRLYDKSRGGAIAKGKVTQDGDNIKISATINGFRKAMIFYYVFITLLYLFVLGSFIFSIEFEGIQIPIFVLPLVLIHALLMYMIPLYVMRKSVKNFKHDLEKDFFYFTKK